MGRPGALTNVEKEKIIQGLKKKQSTLKISKTIGRDHRIVKKISNKPESCNVDQTRESGEKAHVCHIGPSIQ